MIGKKERTVDTIIGAGTIIEGNMTQPKSLRIDGKVIGEINCKGDVFIGKTGIAEPIIYAKNLIIAGTVDAEVHTTEKVHLLKGGNLSGKVTAAGIIIDDGGTFNGHSNIVTGENTKGEKGEKGKQIISENG